MWSLLEEKERRAPSKQLARHGPIANWDRGRGPVVAQCRRRQIELLDANRPDICEHGERCVGAFVLLDREPQPLVALAAMMLASR
jgi:hypothetical protein